MQQRRTDLILGKFLRMGGVFTVACLISTFTSPTLQAASGDKDTPSLFDLFTKTSAPRKEAPAPGLQISPDLVKAMELAEQRARNSSARRCWRYVKQALLDADVVGSYPTTRYAKEAARELTEDFDFVKIQTVTSPEAAPVGSVLVYGGSGAGHVEFRTSTGFVSDYASDKPSNRPLIGVFIKTPGEGVKKEETPVLPAEVVSQR